MSENKLSFGRAGRMLASLASCFLVVCAPLAAQTIGGMGEPGSSLVPPAAGTGEAGAGLTAPPPPAAGQPVPPAVQQSMQAGQAALQARRLDEALQHYTRAIAAAPGFAPAYFSRAAVYMLGGKINEAYVDITKAISLDGSQPGYYCFRGRLVLEASNHPQRFEMAYKDFSVAMEKKPDYIEAYTLRSRLLSLAGRFPEALADCEKAQLFAPKDLSLFDLRARIYLIGYHDPAAALREYTRAIEIAPTNGLGYLTRAEVYLTTGEWDKALADLDKAGQILPREPRVHWLRAQVYQRKGDLKNRIRELAQAIDRSPTSHNLYNERGAALILDGQPDQAIRELDKAIELQDNPSYRDTRAWAYFYNDQSKFAIADSNKAEELDRRYTLGKVLRYRVRFAAGEIEKAVQNLMNELSNPKENDPSLPVLLYLLGLCPLEDLKAQYPQFWEDYALMTRGYGPAEVDAARKFVSKEFAARFAPVSAYAFRGPALDGGLFDFSAVNGSRKLLVYLVDPSLGEAEVGTKAAQRLHQERQRHDLAVVGLVAPPGYKGQRVQTDPNALAQAARDHLSKHSASFPCVIDPTGQIVERYYGMVMRIKEPSLISFFAFPPRAQGANGSAMSAAAARGTPNPADYLYRSLLTLYGIEAPADVDPLAGHAPQAPDITFTDQRGATHRLSDYRSQAVVLVLLSRDCPRCKLQLAFLQEMQNLYGRAARGEQPSVQVLGVCVDAAGESLAKMISERGYTFPIGADSNWAVRGAYRFTGPAPDTFVIAPGGTIRWRHRDHHGELNDVLKMEILTLLNVPTAPLLSAGGYSGDRACRVCHEKAHADASFTRHACAWETLVRMSKQEDASCVPCHVTGHGESGGFTSIKLTPHLAGVQCESCHGPGGCPKFTGQPKSQVPPNACKRCHDAKHSPRFDFETARKKVLHNQAAEILKLPRDQREQRMAKLCGSADRELFNPDTPYVGSTACGRCHPTEYIAMREGPHATAMKSLASPPLEPALLPPHKRNVAGLSKAECLRCHVTGFGRPGGFPTAVPDQPAQHPLAGVGCESCHGPGKAHVEDARAPRAILKLGGTCNECNILPICRQCHDGDNSPTFNYREALKKMRHATGKARATPGECPP